MQFRILSNRCWAYFCVYGRRPTSWFWRKIHRQFFSTLSETVTQNSHASFRLQCAPVWQAVDGSRATPAVGLIHAVYHIQRLFDCLRGRRHVITNSSTSSSCSYERRCHRPYTCASNIGKQLHFNALTPYSRHSINPLECKGNYSVTSHRITWSWLEHWPLMGGLLLWYSEEDSGRNRSPPRPLFAVPNVTVHPSMASVPITVAV